MKSLFGLKTRLSSFSGWTSVTRPVGSRVIKNLTTSAAAVPEPGKSPHYMIVINNEDYRAETAILNKIKELKQDASIRMMTVVGGADTTLVSLMHPAVNHVTGLDMSPAAVHLLHLKLAVAVSDLTTAEAIGFLVHGQNGRNILRETLVNYLPDDSKSFFLSDELDKDIYYGILRKDNDNQFNTDIRRFLEKEHGLDLSRFDAMTYEEKRFLFQILGDPESPSKLYALLKPSFESAIWFQNLPEHMQEHLLTVIDLAAKINLDGALNVLRDTELGLLGLKDYYTEVLLHGQPSITSLPPWLTDTGREILRQKKDSLKTVVGKVEDLDGEKFDFMTLSNIYDFAPEQVATDGIKSLASKSLLNEGKILVRRATGNVDDIMANAGGLVGTKGGTIDNLHHHDRTILFYQHAGTIACAKFN